MTVTDEMIEAASAAITQKHGEYLSGCKSFNDISLNDGLAQAALTAAYPLIRAQVLEEAAEVCEEPMYLVQCAATERVGKIFMNGSDCAQAIRDMKEKQL